MRNRSKIGHHKMKSKNIEGDGFTSRLLFFINETAGIHATALETIKDGVWKLRGARQDWVVKEFSSFEKWRSQFLFLKRLQEAGFTKTYSFSPIHANGPIAFENRIFALISFIEHGKNKTPKYRKRKDRQDALDVLSEFHLTTSGFVNEFHGVLPVFNQLEKWDRRQREFALTIKRIHSHPYFSYLESYARMGKQALEPLKKKSSYFTDQPKVIIHGDVANHNFIRGKAGRLNLIDFDLIARAPRHIDLLQFCSRILPEINWDAAILFSHEELVGYWNERPFLEALLYPTDIFREWNRLLRKEGGAQEPSLPYLELLTKGQYDKRMRFYQQILARCKTLSE